MHICGFFIIALLSFDLTRISRRFVPVMVNKEKALHRPLEDEEETRAYIEQCWAEIMNMYKKGINTKLVFNKSWKKNSLNFRRNACLRILLWESLRCFLK